MNAGRLSPFFWLLFAVVVSVASYRLGLGSLREPGTGFMPFGAAVLLGLLSLVSSLQGPLRKGGSEKEPALFRGRYWPKVALAFAALLVYGQALPYGGFRITTFLLMVFLFGVVEKQRVWKIVVYSLIATAATYYVFSRALNLQFPTGPLGF